MPSRLSVVLRRIRRLAAERKVRFTLKALRELASLELGLDPEDACDVLERLTLVDLAERIRSKVTGEWMFVFKPHVAAIDLYIKLILRDECLVVSFHEDEGPGHEEDR